MFLRTRATLTSIIDGIGMYVVWYCWTSFMLWLSFKLIAFASVGYWQCFGALILVRQIISIVDNFVDKHLRKKTTAADKKKRFKEYVQSSLIEEATKGNSKLSWDEAQKAFNSDIENLALKFSYLLSVAEEMETKKGND